MKTLLAAALVLSACLAPSSAKEPGARPATQRQVWAKEAAPRNLRISFKIKEQDLERSGNFTVADGAQSNYIAGGETPFEVDAAKGKAVEYKKTAVIVNCLPKALSGDLFAVTCQFELSGPGQPTGTLQARPVQTLQFQSEFTLRKGRPLLLIDEPARRIEISIEELF